MLFPKKEFSNRYFSTCLGSLLTIFANKSSPSSGPHCQCQPLFGPLSSLLTPLSASPHPGLCILYCTQAMSAGNFHINRIIDSAGCQTEPCCLPRPGREPLVATHTHLLLAQSPVSRRTQHRLQVTTTEE